MFALGYHCQASGNHRVRRRIKRQPDVRTRHFEIASFESREAKVPIHNAIITRVNRGLQHFIRNISTQRVEKVTRTPRRVAGGHHLRAMLPQDMAAHRVGRAQYSFVRHGAAKRRA